MDLDGRPREGLQRPRWPKMAQDIRDASRWLPRCSKRPQDRSKAAPSGQRAPPGDLEEANILPTP
eukprot:2836819-Pyramimonas_sp.AAC.1